MFKKNQRYLINKNYIINITNKIKIKKTAIEIGSGYGNLTDNLVINNKNKKIILIDTNKTSNKYIKNKYKNKKNISIYKKNFLKLKIKKILNYKKNKNSCTIYGNIPYNITTKILTKIIKNNKYISNVYICIQKEFYIKIINNNNIKNTILKILKIIFKIKKIIQIKNHNFIPKPKINSTFIKLIKKNINNKLLINDLLKYIYKFTFVKFFKKKKSFLNFKEKIISIIFNKLLK